MKSVTVKLADGKHKLNTPTFYALQLMSEHGVDFDDGAIGYSDISGILAALLTDSEPVDKKGLPKREWSPVQVAKMIPIDTPVDGLWETVSELIADAVPKGTGESSSDPTTPAGDGKP